MSHDLAHGGAGLGVQLAQLADKHLALRLVELQHLLQAGPVLLGKQLIVVLEGFCHQRLQCRWLTAFDLQQQTLLQRACSDAGRVEVLQHEQHLFYLLLADIDIMIDGQLVGDILQRFAQHAIVVQRTDEIFHDVALLFGEIGHAYLFLQLVVEGYGLAINHFFAFLLAGHAALIDGQVLIVATQ